MKTDDIDVALGSNSEYLKLMFMEKTDVIMPLTPNKCILKHLISQKQSNHYEENTGNTFSEPNNFCLRISTK